MLKIYNSLSRKLEIFQPFKPPKVGLYVCGPTVYFYPHIGNWRTFTLGDLLARTLKYLGFQVHLVMNITDVGHLTGDNLGDADLGEDRLQKQAQKEKKTAWDVAKFYTDDFVKSYQKLGLTMPTLAKNKAGFCIATNHIKEQIAMIKKIYSKGFAYKTDDGLYFDIQKYEKAGNKYGRMSNLHVDKNIARIKPNENKKDPRDFALWKFSYPSGRNFDPKKDKLSDKRHMEWPSPWGLGYPGWHIECSAMSTKYLGQQFDIHVGGEDHKSTHHPGEIAQAEAASGKKPFVKYWLHGAFLQVNKGRMGKSLGNAYTLHDVEKKGFLPVYLRYFYLTGHYRQPLNFSWQNLKKAKQSYDKLIGSLKLLVKDSDKVVDRKKTANKIKNWQRKFRQALEDDLNMPKVLAVVWQMLKSNLANQAKRKLIISWDKVLGLGLTSVLSAKIFTYQGKRSKTTIQSWSKLTGKIIDLADQREWARKVKDWLLADDLRAKLAKKGYLLQDIAQGVFVKKED